MGEVFDFIVVGAGTAGCMLAARLSAELPKSLILLIEAGPDTSDRDWRTDSRAYESKYADLDWGYTTVAQHALRDRVIPYARGKGLGGSSSINRLIWTSGGHDDYDRWADLVGDESWKWASVKENFKKIIKLHDGVPQGFNESLNLPGPGMEANEFRGEIDVRLPPSWFPGTTEVIQALLSAGIRWNPDMNTGNMLGLGLVWNSFNENKYRVTSYTAYLRETSKPNLTIRTDSPVEKIILEDDRAVAVKLRDGGKIRASKEVILACGAFNSPQLLLLSGIGPRSILESAGISTRIHLPGVGKNLGDHPRVHLLAILNSDNSQEVVIPQQFDTSLINWCQLSSILDSKEYKALPLDAQNFVAMQHNPSCEIYLTIMPHPHDQSIRILNVMVANMNVQSTGSISIRSSNPQDPPVIDPNLLGHPFDRRVMIEGVKEAMRLLTDSPLASQIQEILRGPQSTADHDVNSFLEQWVDTTWHASGTVKMGQTAQDTFACVDSDFKTTKVDGLRVADLSVCPFMPNAHTQSIAYLISWMVANKISSEYSSEKL